MQLEQEEPSRLQQLSDRFYEAREELKNEYLEMFRNDTDTQEAMNDLEEHGTLKYNFRGLIKTLPMEFNDFDEIAQEAFEEFAEDHGFGVDFTLDTIDKKVDEYLMFVDSGLQGFMSLKRNGEEEQIPITRANRTKKQVKELLRETALSRGYNGLMVTCDEYGNVEVVENENENS